MKDCEVNQGIRRPWLRLFNCNGKDSELWSLKCGFVKPITGTLWSPRPLQKQTGREYQIWRGNVTI
jgi:hypothetical protein